MSDRQKPWTPGPWITHVSWPLDIIPIGDADKLKGGATDPDYERRHYFQSIASARFDGNSDPEIHPHRMCRLDESKANARLIAAAPELVEALEMLLDHQPPPARVEDSLKREAIERGQYLLAKIYGDDHER